MITHIITLFNIQAKLNQAVNDLITFKKCESEYQIIIVLK